MRPEFSGQARTRVFLGIFLIDSKGCVSERLIYCVILYCICTSRSNLLTILHSACAHLFAALQHSQIRNSILCHEWMKLNRLI